MSNPDDFVLSGGVLILVVVYMSNPDDFVLSGGILILVVVYMGTV